MADWQMQSDPSGHLAIERHEGGRSGGSVPSTVLAIHSGVCDRRSWNAVRQLLGSEVTFVSYDRRGFGETPTASAAFSHLEDLLYVIEHLGDRPLWLLGNSMGGRLALDACLSAPERVAGLVLLSPGISGSPERELGAATQALGDLIEPAFDAGEMAEVNRLETWLWLDGPHGPEGRVGGAARELFQQMNAIVLANEALQEGLETASEVDAWSRLEAIAVPAVLACGTLDVPTFAENCREAAERLPRGEFLALEGVAHLPSLEAPQAVAALVRRALSL